VSSLRLRVAAPSAALNRLHLIELRTGGTTGTPFCATATGRTARPPPRRVSRPAAPRGPPAADGCWLPFRG